MYGDKSFIITILKFQAFCLLVLALYIVYIVGKALHYLNYLALDKNDPKEIIASIVRQEKSSVFILYAIVLITRNFSKNKFIKLLVSEVFLHNHELVSEVVSGIAKIFNSHKIYQFAQIKNSILISVQ